MILAFQASAVDISQERFSGDDSFFE